jgi:uncharacterized protein HemY
VPTCLIATAVFLVSPFAQGSVPVPTDQATRDVARELGDRGVEAYGKGDWEQARQLFHQAFQLVPAPTLAIREADALVKLGRLVEAREGYWRQSATTLLSHFTRP